MENIPLPQSNDEQTFTRTEVEQLFREFTRKLKVEEAERHEVQELSEDILEELDQSAKSTIQSNLKRFARETPKIKGGKWTTSETINKDFINDLKRHQVDSFQLINNNYRDAERVRLQARAAATIYDSLKRGFEEGGNEDFYDALENVRRLAVYGFATSKEMDQEAKTATLKALRLPESLRHLEEEEPGEKVFALDSETVEKIHKVRYEQSILRSAVTNKRGGYGGNFRGRGFSRGRSFGFSNRARGSGSFFGRGRGRGQVPQETTNPNNNPNNSF